MNNGAVIIPARLLSTRLPRKPLAKINGKTMLEHVFNKCVEAVGIEHVYVATDSEEIQKVAIEFGSKVVMTSSKCLTGTDRLAEANDILDFDFVINVQGDEPMVKPSDIKRVFDYMKKDNDSVINCYCDIEEFEVNSPTVPKVVVSLSNRLLYMSRGGSPFDKFGVAKAKFKQVCIYGFSREHLKAFQKQSAKTPNESIEDIEILRFLELDFTVKMIKVEGGGVAVDTPADLERVQRLISLLST